MARAGQRVRDGSSLEDRVLVGTLARTFPRELVEEVVDAAAARERRNRMLPAWLTVYFVLGLALFMDMGAGRVMRRLAGTLAWAGHKEAFVVPSEQALSNARARLGSAPLRLLFDKAAGQQAEPGRAGASWRDLRLVSLDGTTLDVQDTEANWAHFGGASVRQSLGRPRHGAFPQVRLLALAECSTQALLAACCGSYDSEEKTLARQLLPQLAAGMLVLADTDFNCYGLWAAAAATGAELLWRVDAQSGLPADAVLPDGTYLSRLAPSRLLGPGAPDLTVRVIECHLAGAAGEATESFSLITTLLDPDGAPPSELAELYQARSEIDVVLGAFSSELKGSGIVLRSKTPDGVEQEVWALLCAYHAVRDLLGAAAALAPGSLRAARCESGRAMPIP